MKIQSSPLLNLFSEMVTLRNGQKLAAVSKETQEFLRNSQSQSFTAPGLTGEHLAQVFEETEGRVTEKTSQEFSRTEFRILGALSKLDEFPLNPQVRTFSGIVPGTFRNTDVENQEPSGDRSQNYPHLKVEFFACRASNITDSDSDETSHINKQRQQTVWNFMLVNFLFVENISVINETSARYCKSFHKSCFYLNICYRINSCSILVIKQNVNVYHCLIL